MNRKALIAAVILLASCTIDDRECLVYETRTIVTYPNMGLMAMKGMTAIALMPVYKQIQVCTEYVETKGA